RPAKSDLRYGGSRHFGGRRGRSGGAGRIGQYRSRAGNASGRPARGRAAGDGGGLLLSRGGGDRRLPRGNAEFAVGAWTRRPAGQTGAGRMKVTKEELAAYADGELNVEDAERVAAAIEADP